jgi:hypothetical protein
VEPGPWWRPREGAGRHRSRPAAARGHRSDERSHGIRAPGTRRDQRSYAATVRSTGHPPGTPASRGCHRR